jgi:hypothetical protein
MPNVKYLLYPYSLSEGFTCSFFACQRSDKKYTSPRDVLVREGRE